MTKLEKLKLKLSGVSDNILDMYIEIAESEIMLFLNVDTIETRFDNKVVELAENYYRRDNAPSKDGVKSASYSEGKLSQSETYITTDDYNSAINNIFDSIRRYRKVRL